MQKDVDAQETELSPAPVGLTLEGAVHDEPLYITARPWSSTAAQNDADGHETALNPPPEDFGSTGDDGLHDEPL